MSRSSTFGDVALRRAPSAPFLTLPRCATRFSACRTRLPNRRGQPPQLPAAPTLRARSEAAAAKHRVALIGCHGQTIYHGARRPQHAANRRRLGDRRTDRRAGRLELPRSRHCGRRPGRAAGALRRLPAIPPSDARSRCAQYWRYREHHGHPAVCLAGRRDRVRYRAGQHGDRLTHAPFQQRQATL